MAKLSSTEIYGNLYVEGSILGIAEQATKLATAKTLTIGNKGKTFDGSGNVSWTLDEIGAAAKSHNHGLLHDSLSCTLENTTTDNGWSMINSSYNGFLLKSIRTNSTAPNWICNNYAAGIAFGGADTKGVLSMAYSSPSIKFAGGNSTKPSWWVGLSGTSGTTYDLNLINTAYNHSQAAHAPSSAQKNSDITKAEIEAKLTGNITTHTHSAYAASSHTHKYAGSGSAGGTANSAARLDMERLTGSGNSANYVPGANRLVVREYGNDCANMPSAHWYHIYTGQGGDAAYNTQLAVGMTTDGLYFRNKNANTWGSWKKASVDGHTHNYAGSSSAGGAANSANKLANAKTITIGKKSNPFDGTGNISYTLDDIGAAAKSHGYHIPNPQTADNTKFLRNDNTWQAVTPANIGAAPTSHASTSTSYGASSASNYGHAMASSTTPKANGTAAVGSETAKFARGDHVHPLQTTISGNAGTATKLQTARKINGTSFDGSADITTANWGTARKINQISVNGSADVKLPLDYYTCNIGNSNAKPYHHILTTGQCKDSYTDKSITIVLVNHCNSAGLGIAKATLRTNDAANGATATGELRWLVRSGFAENQLCFNIRNTAKDAYMDVFYKSVGTYNSLTWYVLTEGARGSHGSQWTKYNTHHDNGTNVYDETGMKAIRTYTATLQSAADHGSVNSAKTAAACSGNAATATKLATARTINGTSFNGEGNITTANWGTARTLTIGNKGQSVNGGGNVTWSLADIGALPTSGGTMTGNIKFTDVTSTTYPAKSAMLTWNGSTDGADIYYQVDASDKGRLVLNTRDDADCIIAFANKGTIISTIDNSGNFSGKATKATQDSAGQQINTTYIKGLSVSGKTITYTKGDGTTGTITTQDTNTTYSAGTASALGLTKLYTGTGTATDGTMTQSAIKSALDGKSSTSHTHDSITIKGTNTIASTTNDTTSKWGAQGNSIHWYTETGKLNNQPSQWGYLLNVGQGSEVHQLWMTQSSGDMLHRGGNGSGWSGTWRKILDETNFKTANILTDSELNTIFTNVGI